MATISLFEDVTTTTVASAAYNGTPFKSEEGEGMRTFQIIGKTTNGVGAAAVKIQVTNDPRGATNPTSAVWIDLATISLTLGTTETTDGFSSDAAWGFIRARVEQTGITGTGGTVSCYMGI